MLGGLAFVKGIAACLVSMKYNTLLLGIYVIGLSIVMLTQAICIGVAYSFRANVASTLEKLLFKIIVETYNGASINRNMRIIEGDSALDQAWDYVMARAQ